MTEGDTLEGDGPAGDVRTDEVGDDSSRYIQMK